MNSGIYRIVNKINGKGYVGSASSLNTRNHEHFNKLRTNKHHNSYFQAAFIKYGEINFIFEILEIVKNPTKKKLEEREQYWINYYDAANSEKGYNLCPTAGSPLGKERVRTKRFRQAILDFCIKNGYRPSARSKNTEEKHLADILENYLARIYAEDYLEFKNEVLKFPSARDYKTQQIQNLILKFINTFGYWPSRHSSNSEEERLGNYLRTYLSKDGKIRYPKFFSIVSKFTNKRHFKVLERKKKMEVH